jgi:hypothetical protein
MYERLQPYMVNISVGLERANQQSVKYSPLDRFWKRHQNVE